MKTEQEIKEEIENHREIINNWRKWYKEGQVNKGSFNAIYKECTTTINTLKWVLGENDRYD